MSVYTIIEQHELESFLSNYVIGKLVGFQGDRYLDYRL